jgi:hypothetical protein
VSFKNRLDAAWIAPGQHIPDKPFSSFQ